MDHAWDFEGLRLKIVTELALGEAATVVARRSMGSSILRHRSNKNNKGSDDQSCANFVKLCQCCAKVVTTVKNLS